MMLRLTTERLRERSSLFGVIPFISRPVGAGSHPPGICPTLAILSARGETAMHRGRSFFMLLFLLGSLVGATAAMASEDTSSPPSAIKHEVSVIRQVANLLEAGRDAMMALRGPPIENSNLDRLQLDTPGMHCGIDRVLSYVVCYSDALMNKKDAESMLTRLMDDVQTALAPDSWRKLEGRPHIGVVRSTGYQHRKSGARIEIELMTHSSTQGQSLYSIRVFGWTRP
jgi:hypothetical protein